MKTFIADSIEFVKSKEPALWFYITASIFWIIAIPFRDSVLRDSAIWIMLIALYIRSYKDKTQFEVEQCARDVRDIQHKSILQMLAIVLTELHDIKDEMSREVVVPDKSFWTADTVEQFNNHKP